jgi:hypothetical protein
MVTSVRQIVAVNRHSPEKEKTSGARIHRYRNALFHLAQFLGDWAGMARAPCARLERAAFTEARAREEAT